MLRTILFSLLLLATAHANPLRLSGRVVDDRGHPLGGVSVITDLPGVGTLTNADGRFSLEYDSLISRVTFSSVGHRSRQYLIADLPELIKLPTTQYRLSDITVSADRVEPGVNTIAYANVSNDDIDRDLTVSEFPLLLRNTPNLYTYTDGGAPLGYSYLSIRGFNDQRIATYINGVPLNDPEDHFTYFVDIPDFGANVSDVQVQRGVGNSLYGDASFGGSVNIVSSVLDKPAGSRLTTGFGGLTHNGSFYGRQISKQSIEYASGLVNGQWAYYGRFSRQSTSGYRDNSWYNGWAYYLAVGRLSPKMATELHVYGGPIRMHLAYYGVSKEALQADRLYNPLLYSNETDNFNQPHYQLQNKYFINDHTTLANTLYYIRGKGFYEQFKSNRTYSEYNLGTFSDSSSGDLVRRKWVEKSQAGWNPRLDIDHARGRHSIGGSFYRFSSDHWGQVISAEHLNRSVDPSHRFYEYFGTKTVASVYAQEQYHFTDRLTVQATAQLRFSRYAFDQVKMGAFLGHNFVVDWLFFSPRAGFSYSPAPGTNVYANVAISSRAPNDDNIYDADDPDKYPLLDIKSNSGDTLFTFGDPLNENERVYNFEIGAEKRATTYQAGINLYWMSYHNQYIFDFGADALDSSTTLTIPRSTHAGIELTGEAKVSPSLVMSGEFSYTYNRIDRYVANLSGEMIDFADKKVAGFPEYIGGVMVDATPGRWRLTWRGRFIGQQYLESQNIDSLAIDPFFVSSLSVTYKLRGLFSIGDLSIRARIDNLFDNKYISSGYGGNYLAGPGQVAGWAEYYVAAERSFYGQLSMDLF